MSAGTSRSKKSKRNAKRPKGQSNIDDVTRLENELKDVADTAPETEVSKLRSKLCEVYADAMMIDCDKALRSDVPGKLWMSCFYKKIGENRSRISKERSRLKRYVASANSSQTSSRSGEAVNKQKENLKAVERNHESFIKEGVQFYDFLIDRMQEGLMTPSSQTQRSVNSSQGSIAEDSDRNSLVPLIHKLYIHLGDLHRYHCKFDLAERAYMKASKLAPGKGNPYNQMAVIAQLKDTTISGEKKQPMPALALYWYCRSLAAREVFETSKSNVLRLFQTNEKWLKTEAPTDLFNEGSLRDKIAGLDKETASQIKSTAARTVLARFVAFQGFLFQSVVSFVSLRQDIHHVMDELLKNLGKVLEVHPFGDALLTKIVIVSSFSFWRTFRINFVDSSLDILTNEKGQAEGMVAYTFLLGIVKQLSKYLQETLQKTDEKILSGKRTLSIRSLGPWVLLCEFISFERDRGNDGTTDERSLVAIERDVCSIAIEEFWASVAQIATTITTSPGLSRYLSIARNDTEISSDTLPEEFNSLAIGFSPFSFLSNDNHDDRKRSNAYITSEEALDALDLNRAQTQSQTSQISKRSMSSASEKSGMGAEQSELETKLKLVRFMELVNKHIDRGDLVKHGDIIQVAKAAVDKSFQDEDKNMLSNHSYHDQDVNMEFASQDKSDHSVEHDVQKDFLVYKPSEEGKPALLTPSALLTGNTGEEKDDGSSLLKLTAMIATNSPSATDNATTANSSLVKDLLNPSMMMVDKSPSATQLDKSQAEPMVESSESKHDSFQSISRPQQILPPMPSNSQMTEKSKVPAVRPPPGFQSPSANTAVLPPFNSPPPQASAVTYPNNSGGFALPPHTRMEQDHTTILPPGLPPPSSFNSMPSTRNPFAIADFGMNGSQSQVSRLDHSYRMQPGLSAPFGQQNQDIFSNVLNASNSNQGLLSDLGLTGDLEYDQHDRFGLRSLGIFSDERQTSHEETDVAQRNTLTRNPFAFD